MGKSKSAIARAKFVYFFKETFRARSKAEYREIFSRGLTDDTTGISGAFPWLYVRAFFALLILFTVNTLVLRLTKNDLYIPSVTFLGGITFTVPFIILIYEMYPKRDISLFLIIAILVGGGTVAGLISQVVYGLLPVKNPWLSAVEAGVTEELAKAVPALLMITVLKQKNPYACFLIAATVGAGFSVIEDMGYIFYYSDKYIAFYSSDIQATVALFVDRGFSSFCTHILWTGAIGWAYSYIKNPFRSFSFFFMILVSMGLHICWDLPIDGWWQVLDIVCCVIVAGGISIAIVHLSRVKTLAAETDLTAFNEDIIKRAKEMGERMRFTNAANLTFSLAETVLAVLALLFCAMPIGMDYEQVEFDSKEDFISYLQNGLDFSEYDGDRAYNPDGQNFEERRVFDEDKGQLILSYVVQIQKYGAYNYYYGYYVDGDEGTLDTVAVEVEINDVTSRRYRNEYEFDSEKVGVFDINGEEVRFYSYNPAGGTVTAVTTAEEFEGYDLLIAICAAGCAVTLGCTVILTSLRIKLRRIKDEERQ
ncbi:MAG: PrsW family intramembrane metalloprotease [Clostridia bacterium]|nr:PrsW family intramembrane metalloprotease [Clostridia bacterium]